MKAGTIRLSPAGKKVMVQQWVNNALVRQDIDERIIEKAILSEITNLCAASLDMTKAAGRRKYCVCLDFLAQIEDADEEVRIDNADIEHLQDGLAKSTAKNNTRPTAWNTCRSLWAQLTDVIDGSPAGEFPE